MSNYQDHLDREWAAMGWPTEGEDAQAWIYQHLKVLLDAFAGEGHSGTSAPYTINLFSKLAKFEPLGPLTGGADEWTEIAEEDGKPLYQNKRCSHVFRCGGQAHDIQGKVFEDPDGSRFTSRDSRVAVVFPYTPVTEIVKVSSDDRQLGATP